MTIKTQSNRYAFLTYALGCLAALVLTSNATAQSSSIEFPYQALVAKDDALVRSGPGKVHYGTQKLSAGQVVEVYRHDPDGWCAIRPVEGSFCIIPESTVEIIGEGVGEIKLAGTTPFVGTKLGSVEKPLWQVKLHEKEKVALIGQLSWPSPEGHSTVWYQIEPPAGEFRWIHVDNLESLSGATIASTIAPNPTASTPHKSALSSTQRARPLPTPPTVDRTPTEVVSQSNTASVLPNNNVATTQQPPARRLPEVRRIPSNDFPSSDSVSDQNQSAAVVSNNFDTAPSRVQLASFEPAAALPPTPQYPAPAAATTRPPLQDSGSGWRRATRAIPPDSSAQNTNTGFSQSSSNNQPQFGSSTGYGRSNFTGQQSYANSAPVNPPPSYGREPYDLNSSHQSQRSYSGQVRVADATPDRNHFASQLNQLGSGTTFTGQPSTSNALKTLNNQLTMEMLKAPSQWQLAPLEAATRQYMATGTYADQQAGQQFLAKLANCRKVAAGYSGGSAPSGSGATNGNGFPNGPGNSGSNSRAGSPTSFINTPSSGSNYPRLDQFDATGWLNELKQAGGTQPSTYVLQDQTGKIIYHVTPSPGVNLSRYLKKRIGVNGQLGFNQRLNLKHVTISRVFPL